MSSGFVRCYDMFMDINNDLIDLKEKHKFVELSKLPTIIEITMIFSGDDLSLEDSFSLGI